MDYKSGRMSTRNHSCLTFLFICYQVFFVNGAAISTTATSTETSINDDCSFLPDPNPDQCKSFWGLNKEIPSILISLDGFRSEYLSRSKVESNKTGSSHFAAPTLTCLADMGVKAPYMMPSYPTITFPNHYSIVTGLYPESHEMSSNSFYDPDLNATFTLRNPDVTDPKWWRSGEPMWTTVRKQGKVSATYFWPGSDATFPDEERRPNYYFKYNRSTNFSSRVDTVLQWMDLPLEKRPIFSTLYFEEPDHTGHYMGPDTLEVTQQVTVIDGEIRRLLDGLIQRNIANCVNLIVVSDHGMADSPPGERLVRLSEYIPDLDKTAITFYGPVTSIRLINDTKEEEEEASRALACKNSHMRVYNKWELPYRMHSAHSRRIPDIMLDLDLTWRGAFREEVRNIKSNTGGAHGWDNLYQEMQAIFVAHGPSFKRNLVVRPFENVELYNLMCALANVTPAANNGTWGALHHLLVDEPASLDETELPMEVTMILRMPFELPEDDACKSLKVDNSSVVAFNQEDLNLNMTEERENELIALHAPLGIPIMLRSRRNSSSNNSLLVNEDYLTGYDSDAGLPLWSSYTISGIKNKTGDKDGRWWVQDPRLEPDQIGSCQRLSEVLAQQQVSYTHLFPLEFASREADAWLDTNLLEVPSHMPQLLMTMADLLDKASETYGPINVVSGPTHHHSPAVFFVVSACLADADDKNETEWSLTNCPIENIDLQAFLLPLRQRLNADCVPNEDFIAFNVATLKDVERVTDLHFFPNLPVEEKRSLLIRTTLESRLVINPALSFLSTLHEKFDETAEQ